MNIKGNNNSNQDAVIKQNQKERVEIEDLEGFNGVYVCDIPSMPLPYHPGDLIRYMKKEGKEEQELTREEKEQFRLSPFYHYHELAKYLKRNKKVFEKLTPEEKARFEITDDEYYADPAKYYVKTDEMGKLIMDNDDA